MTKTVTKETEEPKLVQVNLKTLCPNDPKRATILAAGGLVSIEDDAQHKAGFIVDQKPVTAKHRVFVDGRQVEVETSHQTATWLCQTCGARINLDPYE